MHVHQVLETCLYAADLEAAESFYARVLGLEVVTREPGRHVFMRCGSSMVLVFRPEETEDPGEVPCHGARGPGHVAFAVPEAELPRWRAHLGAHQVVVEQEVQHPGGKAIYFRDPAGNSIELVTPRIWGYDEPREG